MAQIFDMGNRYLQREETVHLAVELIDRIFLHGNEKTVELLASIFIPPHSFDGRQLDRSSCSEADPSFHSPSPTKLVRERETAFEMLRIKTLSLLTITCFIIASKYDELDENIPLISDLQRYFTIKVLPPQIAAPTPEEVIECESIIMEELFQWDLMSIADMMPTHIVNYLLANGILFDNEVSSEVKGLEIAARLADRSLIMLDTLVWEKGLYPILRDAPASQLSAAVILAARIEEFTHDSHDGHHSQRSNGGWNSDTKAWPLELELLTHCSVTDIDLIAQLLIKLNSQVPMAEHHSQSS